MYNVYKGNFPLAECKKTKWKMFFSHTAGSLGTGHVTEGRAVAFVASTVTDLFCFCPFCSRL